MRKLFLFVVSGMFLITSPIIGLAAERKLSGNEIAQLLPTIVAQGNRTRQTFSKAGATTYTNDGRDSYGSWRVQGDKYCSQWPPSGTWDCFAVWSVDGQNTIVWIDNAGNRIKNGVFPKK